MERIMALALVAGALANKPHNGGEAWVRLSWVLGLKRLGLRVLFVEEVARASCVDAAGAAADFRASVNRAYFEEVTRRFGLEGSSALVYDGGADVFGMDWTELCETAAAADLLVNISGHLASPRLFAGPRRRAYVDIDPGYTQFWHASRNPGARLDGHDLYFTIAANLGDADCTIPAGGLPWRRVRPPVVLDEWPVAPTGAPERFTTVASWRGAFGPVEYGGKVYGVKAHQFRKFLELPRRSRGRFEIALSIHPGDERDRQALLEHGWHLTDPRAAAGDPFAFRRYVQASGAEFSAAQGVYVETESGWFSDRTAHYLASGKPALVQDTGLGRRLPVGAGLVAFRTLDEAAAGAERIRRDYEAHCRAARSVAEEFFDSDKVLGQFLDEVGLAP